MSASAVIFDFDGVIASTEDLHLQGYNRALDGLSGSIGRAVQVNSETYFDRYVVYGSADAFAHMLSDAGVQPTPPLIRELCQTKDRFLDMQLDSIVEPLPGVRPLLEFLASKGTICGICSSARRAEIIKLISAMGIKAHFRAIVSSDDVTFGKPHPEGYQKAFEILKTQSPDLAPNHALVIEDTAGGAAAAADAGFRVLGVATTSPLEAVCRWATWAVPDLTHVDLQQVQKWLAGAS